MRILNLPEWDKKVIYDFLIMSHILLLIFLIWFLQERNKVRVNTLKHHIVLTYKSYFMIHISKLLCKFLYEMDI